MSTSEDANEGLEVSHTCTPRENFASEVLTSMARNSAAGSKRPCSEGEDEEKAAEDAPPRKRGATTADLVGEEEKNNIPSIPYEEALARNKTPKKEKEPWFRNPGQLFAPNHKGVTTYVADLLVSPHAAVVCGYNSFFIVDGGGTDEKVEVKVAPRRPFTLEGDLATTGASPTGWARSKGPHRATVVTRCRPTGAPDRSLPVRVNVTSPSWPRSVPINIALHYRAMEGNTPANEKKTTPRKTKAARPSRPLPSSSRKSAFSTTTSSRKPAQPAPSTPSSSSSSTSSSKKPAGTAAPAAVDTTQSQQTKPAPQAQQTKPRRTKKGLVSALLDVESHITRRMDRLRQKAEIARKRYDQAKELLRGINNMREIFGSSDSETE